MVIALRFHLPVELTPASSPSALGATVLAPRHTATAADSLRRYSGRRHEHHHVFRRQRRVRAEQAPGIPSARLPRRGLEIARPLVKSAVVGFELGDAAAQGRARLGQAVHVEPGWGGGGVGGGKPANGVVKMYRIRYGFPEKV